MFLGVQLYQYKINIVKGIVSTHPCTIFILYGALVFAPKTTNACPIELAINPVVYAMLNGMK